MLCRPNIGTELVPWGTSKEGQPFFGIACYEYEVRWMTCRSVWTGAADRAAAPKSSQYEKQPNEAGAA